MRLLESTCYSVDDLAARFCVSRRTIYRDLRLLAVADVPLMSQGRRDGLSAGRRSYHVPSPAPPAPS